ncbi:MAG: heme-dependent peroxidase [Candidatus Eremiobacteraeota bacterium]|nr:heme-dependent peroxidase [Candidatus Eremiobacteraeota bacterium]
MRHPAVPETLDGWRILHRMVRFRRRAFDALPAAQRFEIADEARSYFDRLARSQEGDVSLAQLLGHKSDLMLTHYAENFDALAAAQTAFDKLALADYTEDVSSYVSVLELGLYEATAKLHASLADRGLKARSPEWNKAFDSALSEQERQPRNAERLWAKVPARRYVCFYPMDKRRGESVNWYELPYAERARLLVDHGKIGRSFHGVVTQVISGSIGFDDWEWGVDLYADEPLIFKKLIYEMRFDAASARYAAFGPFYTGLQFSISELARYLEGDGVPQLVNDVLIGAAHTF